MKCTHTIRILTAAAVCIATAQTASPASYIRMTETMRRAERAEQNGDRSELPFLEATALKENAERLDRRYTVRAYLKIATLDECVDLMRKLRHIENDLGNQYHFLLCFLDRAYEEEKDAENGTREKLFSFMLEVAQTGCEAEAYLAEGFLLKRLSGYADSKQRATLLRYADSKTKRPEERFKHVKEHFDKIPPSKRVDLRKRFPGLPPLDEPPEETPEETPEPPPPPPGRTVSHLWPALISALIIALTLALLKRKRS